MGNAIEVMGQGRHRWRTGESFDGVDCADSMSSLGLAGGLSSRTTGGYHGRMAHSGYRVGSSALWLGGRGRYSMSGWAAIEGAACSMLRSSAGLIIF